MKPKMIWANLAVSDLERTTAFYNKLGFTPNGKNDSKELRSFLIGEHNFVIHFFLKDLLRKSMMGELADTQSENEILFTISATSKDQVDDWEKEVEMAGGRVVSKPEEFGSGYYGFVFADPDGHRFNVFYMKGFE